jgi:hypothetical protein
MILESGKSALDFHRNRFPFKDSIPENQKLPEDK